MNLTSDLKLWDLEFVRQIESGASATLMALCETKSTKVVVKCFADLSGRFLRTAGADLMPFVVDPGDESVIMAEAFQSLLYEIDVYRYITDVIVARDGGANFVEMIGVCSSLETPIDEDSLESGISTIQQLVEQGCKTTIAARTIAILQKDRLFKRATKDNLLRLKRLVESKPIYALVTHACTDAIPFNRWSRARARTNKSVWLQLLMVAITMQAHGIAHNDCHGSNILVKTLSAPVAIRYTLTSPDGTSQVYEIKTLEVLYIYDWDFASASHLPYANPKAIGLAAQATFSPSQFRIGADLFTAMFDSGMADPLGHLYGIPPVESVLKNFVYIFNSQQVIDRLQKLANGRNRALLTVHEIDSIMGREAREVYLGEGLIRADVVFGDDGESFALARSGRDQFYGRLTFETSDLPTPLDMLGVFQEFRSSGVATEAKEVAIPLTADMVCQPLPTESERLKRRSVIKSLQVSAICPPFRVYI